MNMGTYTNDELIRALRDDKSMSDREMLLLDRIVGALDELDALTAELRAANGSNA